MQLLRTMCRANLRQHMMPLPSVAQPTQHAHYTLTLRNTSVIYVLVGFMSSTRTIIETGMRATLCTILVSSCPKTAISPANPYVVQQETRFVNYCLQVLTTFFKTVDPIWVKMGAIRANFATNN